MTFLDQPRWFPQPLTQGQMKHLEELAKRLNVREPNSKGRAEIREARLEHDARERRLKQMREWHEKHKHIPRAQA